MEEWMNALVHLWLHTDADDLGRLFYDGMNKGYVMSKFRVFTANPVQWYNSLDMATRRAVLDHLNGLLEKGEE